MKYPILIFFAIVGAPILLIYIRVILLERVTHELVRSSKVEGGEARKADEVIDDLRQMELSAKEVQKQVRTLKNPRLLAKERTRTLATVLANAEDFAECSRGSREGVQHTRLNLLKWTRLSCPSRSLELAFAGVALSVVEVFAPQYGLCMYFIQSYGEGVAASEGLRRFLPAGYYAITASALAFVITLALAYLYVFLERNIGVQSQARGLIKSAVIWDSLALLCLVLGSSFAMGGLVLQAIQW